MCFGSRVRYGNRAIKPPRQGPEGVSPFYFVDGATLNAHKRAPLLYMYMIWCAVHYIINIWQPRFFFFF